MTAGTIISLALGYLLPAAISFAVNLARGFRGHGLAARCLLWPLYLGSAIVQLFRVALDDVGAK